jgi:predicted TIM-barrel fold metal-dependent hydrolase
MLHGADPWWDVAIRLLQRHRNLTMCTSAWSPKRLPEQLISYLAKRGSDKVMWASDYPVFPIDRSLREARELGLAADVLTKFLHDNAERVFFGARTSRHVEHAPL